MATPGNSTILNTLQVGKLRQIGWTVQAAPASCLEETGKYRYYKKDSKRGTKAKRGVDYWYGLEEFTEYLRSEHLLPELEVMDEDEADEKLDATSNADEDGKSKPKLAETRQPVVVPKIVHASKAIDRKNKPLEIDVAGLLCMMAEVPMMDSSVKKPKLDEQVVIFSDETVASLRLIVRDDSWDFIPSSSAYRVLLMNELPISATGALREQVLKVMCGIQKVLPSLPAVDVYNHKKVYDATLKLTSLTKLQLMTFKEFDFMEGLAVSSPKNGSCLPVISVTDHTKSVLFPFNDLGDFVFVSTRSTPADSDFKRVIVAQVEFLQRVAPNDKLESLLKSLKCKEKRGFTLKDFLMAVNKRHHAFALLPFFSIIQPDVSARGRIMMLGALHEMMPKVRQNFKSSIWYQSNTRLCLEAQEKLDTLENQYQKRKAAIDKEDEYFSSSTDDE